MDGRLIKVSVGVGVAALDGRHATLASLLTDVDSALRPAQQAGGNGVRVAAFRSHPKAVGAGDVEDIMPGVPDRLQLPSAAAKQHANPDHKRKGEA